jgi:hypothetical protein
MMNNFPNFGFTFGITKLFSLAFIIGLIFLIVWALKNLKKDQLLNWGIVLLVVGILGWFLAGSYGGYGMHSKFGSFNKAGTGMMMGGMMDCMQDEECHEEMEDFMHDVMGLEHEE